MARECSECEEYVTVGDEGEGCVVVGGMGCVVVGVRGVW